MKKSELRDLYHMMFPDYPDIVTVTQLQKMLGSRRKIDIGAEGYEPIPEIRKWLEKYPVPERLAPEVTEIEMDGGSEIYTQLCPFWDGEDGAFDLNTITEAELRQFPNLKHITLMSSKPEQVLPVLERCGIKVDLL